MAGIKLIKDQLVPVVSLAEAKNFLRVDDIDDDDDLITGLVKAATVACETHTRRSFLNKDFLQTLDSFPYFTDTIMSQMAFPPSYYSLPRFSTTLWNYSQMIKLFRPPLFSLNKIVYMASGDASFHAMMPQPQPWYPDQDYEPGDQVTDFNSNVQTLIDTDPSVSPTLRSGIDPPVWNGTVGLFTIEPSPATAVWRNDGPAKNGEFGAFIADAVSEPARVFPGIGNPQSSNGFWPSVLYIPNAVQIHMTCGYGPSAADIPDGIKTAVKQTLADWYENRLPTTSGEEQLPRHVRAILGTYRVIDFAPTRG